VVVDISPPLGRNAGLIQGEADGRAGSSPHSSDGHGGTLRKWIRSGDLPRRRERRGARACSRSSSTKTRAFASNEPSAIAGEGPGGGVAGTHSSATKVSA